MESPRPVPGSRRAGLNSGSRSSRRASMVRSARERERITWIWLSIVEASGGELMFVGETVTLGRGTGMGIRESDGALKDKFDTAIASMKDDGSLNELLIKWFGEGTDTY